MTLYGLADSRLIGTELGEVIELFTEQEAAEQALRDVLTDESAWVGDLSIVEIPGLRYEPN